MTTQELARWIRTTPIARFRGEGDRRGAWLHRMFALATVAEDFDLEELNPNMLEALLSSAPLMLATDASGFTRAGRDIWTAVKESWKAAGRGISTPAIETIVEIELAANKKLK